MTCDTASAKERKNQCNLQDVYHELRDVEHAQRELNDKVSELRKRIHMLTNPEQYIETSEELDWSQGYADAIQTLRQFDFPIETIPTFEDVMNAFSEEQRRAIADMKNPTLLLMPNIDFAEKLDFLWASHFVSAIFVSERTFGDVKFGPQKSVLYTNTKKIMAWTPVMIEGTQNMDALLCDNPMDVLQRRLITARKNRKPCVNGIDRDQYAMLAMHSLVQGEPVDTQTRTILDGDHALKGNTIPMGHIRLEKDPSYEPSALHFNSAEAGGIYPSIQFRSSVTGKVIRKA